MKLDNQINAHGLHNFQRRQIAAGQRIHKLGKHKGAHGMTSFLRTAMNAVKRPTVIPSANPKRKPGFFDRMRNIFRRRGGGA